MKGSEKWRFVARSPSDRVLLQHWDAGSDTAEIAKQFHYPEYCIESRLWRLREERRHQQQARTA